MVKLLIALVLLLSWGNYATAQSITLVASERGRRAGDGSSNSVDTGAVTTQVGDLAIVGCGYYRFGGATANPVVTDSKSNTGWTQVSTYSPLTPSADTRITLNRTVIEAGKAGSGHTFRCTSGTGGDAKGAIVAIFRSTLGWPANPESTGASSTGSGTTPSSGATGTPSQASSLRVGYLGTNNFDNPNNWTPGSGFTICTNCSDNDTTYYIHMLEYKIESAAGTTACNATLSSPDPWAAICVVFVDDANQRKRMRITQE